MNDPCERDDCYPCYPNSQWSEKIEYEGGISKVYHFHTDPSTKYIVQFPGGMKNREPFKIYVPNGNDRRKDEEGRIKTKISQAILMRVKSSKADGPNIEYCKEIKKGKYKGWFFHFKFPKKGFMSDGIYSFYIPVDTMISPEKVKKDLANDLNNLDGVIVCIQDMEKHIGSNGLEKHHKDFKELEKHETILRQTKTRCESILRSTCVKMGDLVYRNEIEDALDAAKTAMKKAEKRMEMESKKCERGGVEI